MSMDKDAPLRDSCQLKDRHWYITSFIDSSMDEVHGRGVVGEHPVMKPGKFIFFYYMIDSTQFQIHCNVLSCRSKPYLDKLNAIQISGWLYGRTFHHELYTRSV